MDRTSRSSRLTVVTPRTVALVSLVVLLTVLAVMYTATALASPTLEWRAGPVPSIAPGQFVGNDVLCPNNEECGPLRVP